jgi:hypothetical protein
VTSAIKLSIDNYDFAMLAQLIQRSTGCGGLTSNILMKKICLTLRVDECEGRTMVMEDWEKEYVQ